MKIIYQEFQPLPVLRQIVDCYTYTAGEGFFSEISNPQYTFPSGMAEVVFHLNDKRSHVFHNQQWQELPEIYLAGIMETPKIWRMEDRTALFSIRFKPEGFFQLFPPFSGYLQHAYTDISVQLKQKFASFLYNITACPDHQSQVALVEVFLQDRLSKKGNPEPNYFNKALEMIRNTEVSLSIDQLSKAVCVSERQLQRTFKEHIGLGPKSYFRIIRFRKAYQFLQTNPKVSFASIASCFGYADQAHFIRDFKGFSGRTPKSIPVI